MLTPEPDVVSLQPVDDTRWNDLLLSLLLLSIQMVLTLYIMLCNVPSALKCLAQYCSFAIWYPSTFFKTHPLRSTLVLAENQKCISKSLFRLLKASGCCPSPTASERHHLMPPRCITLGNFLTPLAMPLCAKWLKTAGLN